MTITLHATQTRSIQHTFLTGLTNPTNLGVVEPDSRGHGNLVRLVSTFNMLSESNRNHAN